MSQAHFSSYCYSRCTLVFITCLCMIMVVSGQVCTCDLTEKSCDPNCCCDPDCSLSDKDSFLYCINADTNQDDRVCVSDNVVLFDNTKFKSQGTGKGLFCIYKDNFAERNFYTTVQTATTESTFKTLADKYRKSSFTTLLPEDQPFTSSSKYKVGDKVLLLFSSDIPGFLTIPKPLGTSECSDQNPAGFLQSASSKCTRRIQDLPSQCLGDRSFSAKSYFDGFKVVPSPAFLADVILQRNVSVSSSVSPSPTTAIYETPTPSTSSPSVTSFVVSNSSVSVNSSVTNSSAITSSASSTSGISSSAVNASATTSSVIDNPPAPGRMILISQVQQMVYSSSSLVNVTVKQPLFCQTDSGVMGTCNFVSPPSPTFDFQQKVCNNVVLKVSYLISYSDHNTLNISSVVASFTFGNIKLGRTSFQQEFDVAFQKNATDSVFKRSGNPGYRIGEPLLAGTLVTNVAEKKEAIQLSTDSSKWLSVVRAGLDGSCAKSTQRTAVTFGKNVRSGCYVSIKKIMTTAECSALQAIIYNTLLKNMSTHVGMFGNSAVSNVGDWVKIINIKPTNTPLASNGECQNIVLGVGFEILHSKTGFLSNPQQKIVGVRVKYEASRSLRYQCVGPYCLPGSTTRTHQIDVVQCVSFVDVSASLEAKEKPIPEFTTKAPHDFFYPFV